MARETQNVIPISMAVLLHVIIFGSMIVAFDYARPAPLTPLVVKATVVQEIPETPPRQQRQPEPEPEPPPPEPEPEPEPDNTEELRRQAEEEKRQQDALLEQQRLEELKRQEEEDRKRKEREEAERKKKEEEELERKRIEAERKRQEDIQRQREENERRRREMEAEQRELEIAAEEQRAAENESSEMAVYQAMIRQKIFRNWSVPASMKDNDVCIANVRQARGGDVISVTIGSCTGDDAVRRSIEAAIYRAAPLPNPPTPNLFRADLQLRMTKQTD